MLGPIWGEPQNQIKDTRPYNFCYCPTVEKYISSIVSPFSFKTEKGERTGSYKERRGEPVFIIYLSDNFYTNYFLIFSIILGCEEILDSKIETQIETQKGNWPKSQKKLKGQSLAWLRHQVCVLPKSSYSTSIYLLYLTGVCWKGHRCTDCRPVAVWQLPLFSVFCPFNALAMLRISSAGVTYNGRSH